MRNKFGKLPKGAYNKDLIEVLEPYMKHALKDTTITRTILEIYLDQEIEYTMPEALFNLLVNAYEQATLIDSQTTITFLIEHLPLDLRHNIKVLKINHTAGRPTRENGADYTAVYTDELKEKNE